jgi:hypothetical protein
MQMTRTMMLAMTLVMGLLLVVAAQPRESVAAEKGGYRIGDRLPASTAPATGKAAAVKEINWEALMPANWNPMKSMEAINLGAMDDGDPRAQKALQQMRDAWNNAPVEKSLNGIRVRIAGFVVPLEGRRGEVSEFLLVPYYGACIHTPPPPPNQIIHVNPAQPLKSDVASDAVWVSGVLETVRSETGMGDAGYRMRADTVMPYRKP